MYPDLCPFGKNRLGPVTGIPSIIVKPVAKKVLVSSLSITQPMDGLFHGRSYSVPEDLPVPPMT